MIEQVANVCQTTIARDAWERGQPLSVHGWIYGIADGLARDLGTTVADFREAAPVYEAALAEAREPSSRRRSMICRARPRVALTELPPCS